MRRIRMTDEVVDALKQQAKDFEAQFGRPPGRNDPVFFNPDSNVPESMSEQQITEHGAVIADAMRQAGVDPAVIYAYEKVGFLASEKNWHLLDAGQRKEWMDAIAEYESIPED
jgi:hypothetical protein